MEDNQENDNLDIIIQVMARVKAMEEFILKKNEDRILFEKMVVDWEVLARRKFAENNPEGFHSNFFKPPMGEA